TFLDSANHLMPLRMEHMSPLCDERREPTTVDLNDRPSFTGMMLGRYRVLGPIGRGGMGTVYLAKDTRLGGRVALKLLPTIYTGNEELLRRFKQEARTTRALNHPNIMTVYDIAEVDGTHFIIAEYVEGVTLRSRILEGKMALPDILDVAVQVASALAVAHR